MEGNCAVWWLYHPPTSRTSISIIRQALRQYFSAVTCSTRLSFKVLFHTWTSKLHTLQTHSILWASNRDMFATPKHRSERLPPPPPPLTSPPSCRQQAGNAHPTVATHTRAASTSIQPCQMMYPNCQETYTFTAKHAWRWHRRPLRDFENELFQVFRPWSLYLKAGTLA